MNFPTRWVEGADGSACATTLCLGIKKLMKYWLGLSKSKMPKDSKSYDTLVKYYTDEMIPGKFNFSSILLPF